MRVSVRGTHLELRMRRWRLLYSARFGRPGRRGGSQLIWGSSWAASQRWTRASDQRTVLPSRSGGENLLSRTSFSSVRSDTPRRL